MSYKLSFELNELPLSLNRVLRLNRWERAALYDDIYQICRFHIHGKQPEEPLEKFTLRFERHTIKPVDIDSLVASFKPILDSLEKYGVILNDGWELVNFKNTSYEQVQVKTKKEQKIILEINSL